jgi:hypothetical protein
MKRLLLLFAGICACVTLYALAAEREKIEAGAAIPVRTSEWISSKRADGRVFYGTVDANVPDERGEIAIPRGAQVELLIRDAGRHEFVLDLDSVAVEGRRYAIAADAVVDANHRDGVGDNRRTAKFLGGGAVLGTIVGAIAGGGKGAAIGAVAGASAGAGSQMVTRGKALNIPAESVITFRLEQPLVIAAGERGFERDGHHYHPIPPQR